MRELDIQKKILTYLRHAYPEAVTVKLSDRWVSGLPDIMFIRNGKIYFFEVKTKTGKVSNIQRYFLDKLKANKTPAVVVTSLEEVKAVIEE